MIFIINLKMAANPQNQPLVDFLIQLAQLYKNKQPQDSQDPFRSRTFNDLAIKIKNNLTAITSGQQAKSLISKIGASSIKEIDQFLTTGTSERLQSLLGSSPGQQVSPENIDKQNTLKQLQTVHGVGPVKANQLYDLGVRNIADLQNYLDYLNTNSKIALYFYNDLQQRIPRQYIEQVENFIQQIMDYIQQAYQLTTPVEWQIAGSYRRGLPNSGDIDIIIKSIPGINLIDISNILIQSGLIPSISLGENNNIAAILAQGAKKTLAVAQLPNQPAVRLDLLYIEPEKYPFGLFYFTGSQYFNILMRKIALSKGWSLNEYRLIDTNSNQDITNYIDLDQQTKPIVSEQDIFKVLGVEYIAPESRNYSASEEELLARQLNLSGYD